MVRDVVSLQDVTAAREVLKGVIRETPVDKSRTFSELTNSELYLKLENLQKTGSFKVRGAYVKISSLSDSEKKRGVVAASAGNHAQGVAYAASLLGVKSTVIMPEHASPAKVDATKGYGAGVILHGRTFDDSLRLAKAIAKKERSTFIHAFDDPKVIAGQGTIALELIEAQPDLETIITPIGGGGLASGIAMAAKSLRPGLRVIGVQSRAYPAMSKAFKTGRLGPVTAGDTLADGISVKQPGRLTFGLISRFVDDIMLVDDTEIAKGVFLLLERAKTVAEPAGAAAVAAALSGRAKIKGKSCVAIVSGGNIDMYILDQIVSKGLVMENRLTRVRFTLPDMPGALKEVIDVVARAKGNVVDVQHERMGEEIPVGRAQVTLSVETQNRLHTKNLLSSLDATGLRYEVLG